MSAFPENEQFMAGRLEQFAQKWCELTSDQSILDTVKHCHIEFDDIPTQSHAPREIKFNESEQEVIDKEIDRLLKSGAIVKSEHCPGEIISTIFIRPKRRGGHRMILNLKNLNESVTYHHFKMESLLSAIKLVTPMCYMGSIDLQEAFHGVPIAKEHQKYLKFTWKGQLFQYACLPFGLSSSPRIFTKLLKPVYSTLRNQGHVNVGYIDDSFLEGETKPECKNNIDASIELFMSLGFMINYEKSILIPAQKLDFLGFTINSIDMNVKVAEAKIDSIIDMCTKMCMITHTTVRELSKVIGVLIATFPGVQHGPLHYRTLELGKIKALKCNRGDFDGIMTISEPMKKELQWWCNNIRSAFKPISHGNPDITLTSDASSQGWGSAKGETSTGGRWTDEEAEKHINILELKAAFFALRSFCETMRNVHVKLLIDNTTSVAYINHMGGTKSLGCNEIAVELWDWCIERGIWVSASHIPGVSNVLADKESRVFHDETEWMLDPALFKRIQARLMNADIDLFASRLNKQLDKFVSWNPDPFALHVDAFTIDWNKLTFYAFPPFSVIGRCVQKIQQDSAEGIMIVPAWPTQSWYPRLLQMLVDKPIVLPKSRHLLHLPYKPDQHHPLGQKLVLIACHVSGNRLKSKTFLQEQCRSSWPHGGKAPSSSTGGTWKNGFGAVVRNTWIHFNLL